MRPHVLLYLVAMFKHIRAAAFLLVFALAAAAQSPAQNWINVKALAVGTSVRVSVGSRTVNGDLQHVTDDSLTFNVGKGQEMITRQEVKQVSVKEKGHRGRNALIGLGIGVGAGAAAGLGARTEGNGQPLTRSRALNAAIGAVPLGVIGTLVGAVIPTGGWREVYKR